MVHYILRDKLLFVIVFFSVSTSFGQKYYQNFDFKEMKGLDEISEKSYLKLWDNHIVAKVNNKKKKKYYNAFKVYLDSLNEVKTLTYAYFILNKVSENRYEVSDSLIDSEWYQKAIFSLENQYIKSEVYSYGIDSRSLNYYSYAGHLLKREYSFRGKVLYIDSVITEIDDGTFNHEMLEGCKLFDSCSKDKWIYETQKTFDMRVINNIERPIEAILRMYKVNQAYKYDFFFTSLLGFKHPAGIYDSYIHCNIGLGTQNSLFTTYYDLEGTMMLKEVKHWEVRKGNKRRRLKYIKPFHKQPKM